MIRIVASYRALGPAGPRHPRMPVVPVSLREHRVWCVDTIHARVVAVEVHDDSALWLAGDAVYVIVNGASEPAPLTEVTPPGLDVAGPKRWVKLEPSLGARVVVLAGAAQAPDPRVQDRDALLEAMLSVPAVAERGWFGKLLGKRAPEPEAVALILDVVAGPVLADLPAWIADVLARDVDISWAGNETGPGFVHALRRPFTQASVADGLLDHAREDPELTRLIRESAEVELEDRGDAGPIEGRLVPDDPTRGWIEPLELDASAESLRGTAGAWLDRATPQARRAWTLELPGAAIVAALRQYVEQPTIVAVHSAPSEAVSAVHLLGGIDRASGDLVGFALHRIWT